MRGPGEPVFGLQGTTAKHGDTLCNPGHPAPHARRQHSGPGLEVLHIRQKHGSEILHLQPGHQRLHHGPVPGHRRGEGPNVARSLLRARPRVARERRVPRRGRPLDALEPGVALHADGHHLRSLLHVRQRHKASPHE